VIGTKDGGTIATETGRQIIFVPERIIGSPQKRNNGSVVLVRRNIACPGLRDISRLQCIECRQIVDKAAAGNIKPIVNGFLPFVNANNIEVVLAKTFL
jgi:hypothetical protein